MADHDFGDLATWTWRLHHSHLALGAARAELIRAWSEHYLDSQEPSASGAKQHADALTAAARSTVALLEADVAAQEVIVDFLRRMT